MNTTSGCKWSDELRSYDKHLTKCRFALVPCPNKCQPDTDFLVLRKDLQKHLKTDCRRRKYQCPHCKKSGEYQERTTTHLVKCPKVKVLCPNKDCGEKIARCDLNRHRKDCPFERVPCKYARLGCNSKLFMRDRAEHESDTAKHLQMAIDTVGELKSKLTQMETATFKLNNFEQHKISSDSVRSPPFYTRPEGHKLCIEVRANGEGDGKSTHVAVYAVLIQGPNDKYLPWPFAGRVTVELLNQLEDDTHYTRYIKFPGSGTSDSIAERYTGLGFGQYISHSSLGFNAERNCQYLKDDCLCFRLKTELPSNPKPWLNMTGCF